MNKDLSSDDETKIKDLIWEVISCGKLAIDDSKLKRIKSYCRYNPAFIPECMNLLLGYVQEGHSQIRLGAVRLIDVLANRSSVFCQLCVANLSLIVQSCVSELSLADLKPPVYSVVLVQWATRAIVGWSKKYGKVWSELILAGKYASLRSDDVVRHFDAAIRAQAVSIMEQHKGDLETAFEATERLKAERLLETKMWLKIASRVQMSRKPFSRLSNRISALLSSLQDEKIVLKPNLPGEAASDLSALGIPSKYELELQLCRAEIVQSLGAIVSDTQKSRDLLQASQLLEVAVQKWKPRFQRWLKALKQLSVEPPDSVDPKQIIQWILEQVKGVETFQQLWDDLDLGRLCDIIKSNSSVKYEVVEDDKFDFTDEEFELVEDFPLNSTNDLGSELLKELANESTEKLDKDSPRKPTSDSIQKLKLDSTETGKQKSSNLVSNSDNAVPNDLIHEWKSQVEKEKDEKRKELLASAPFVSYDTDLDFWDKTKIQFHELGAGGERAHRFYGTSEGDNYISESALARLKTRVVKLEASTSHKPTRACRAALPDGTLCPRMDWERCPFHGPIVPRDDSGNIIGISARKQPTASDILAPVDPKTAWQNISQEKKDEHSVDIRQITSKKRRVGPYWVAADSELVDIYNTSAQKTKGKTSVKRKVSKLLKSNAATDDEKNQRIKDKFLNNWTSSNL